MKTLYRKIRNVKRRFNNPHLKKSIIANYKWYGSTYGGFFCCPDLLNSQSIVYSFGLGEDITFDKAIIEKHDCQVFGFDPTPKSLAWLNTQKIPKGFKYYNFGIGIDSGDVNFFLPKNPDYVSGSIVVQTNINPEETITIKVKSFSDITKYLGHKKIDVLKMDIEGIEYALIDSIVGTDIIINQILIEFHDRFFEDGKLKTKNAVNKLKSHGFEIFAVSPTYEEVSFINKNTI